MKKNVLMAIVLFICLNFMDSGVSYAQRNIKAELKQEIVKIENGNYSIEEFGVIGTFDKDYQVKVSASAPINLISRDNFARYYGAFSSSVFVTYLNQEGIKAPDDLLLVRKEKPGESIDLTVTILMNEKGIDYVVESENSKSKMNIQWQYQLFTDPPQRNE